MAISAAAFNICSSTIVFADDNYQIENGVLKRACNLRGEVTLPSNITSIVDRAFDKSCTDIAKLVIPGSVKNIGKNAFEYLDNCSFREVILEGGKHCFKR